MLPTELKSEIKLQINQRLYESRLITREMYEEAKIRIVAEAKFCETRTESHSQKPEVCKDIPAF